jgi:astacin
LDARGKSIPNSVSTRSVDPGAVSYTEFGDGRYFAVLRIDATDAAAVRLRFSSFALPVGAELFIYSTKGGAVPVFVAGPYRGVGPLDGNEFWSDAIPGGTIVIELQVRREIPALLPFEIDLVEKLSAWTPPAAPATSGKVKSSAMYREEAVEYDLTEDGAVLEGDILLGDVLDLPSVAPGHSKDRSKSAIGVTSTYYRWPNGVIPYEIDPSISVSTASILDAINQWNTQLAGVINLTPRTAESNYIRFVAASGCNSYVGRIGGAQPVNLTAACTTGNIVHEIGHVVGLHHEQSREDRNTWVKVNTANIATGSASNFNQFNSSADDLIYYGYNSIMHYSTAAFSWNGQPTIETIPAGIPVGQRVGLDISDIAAVRKMYFKETATVSVSSVPTGLTVMVDGVAVVTPASFNWAPGSAHTIGASATAAHPAAPSQYTFVRWTNGGAATQTIVVPVTGLAVAATYALQHRLTTTVAPALTGTLSVAPASPNLLYGAGTNVTLNATPAVGYCFSNWTGLAAGTSNATSLLMSRSLSVAANFIAGAITPAVTAVTVAAAGGTFTMDTTATTGCGWTIQALDPWLTVSKTYATSASPSFTYTVQPNTTLLPRTGSLVINGRIVSVTQTP